MPCVVLWWGNAVEQCEFRAILTLAAAINSSSSSNHPRIQPCVCDKVHHTIMFLFKKKPNADDNRVTMQRAACMLAYFGVLRIAAYLWVGRIAGNSRN